ncbi:MAG: hypothetical protein ACXIUO_06425 [Erythrobacter sp.]
MNAKGSLKQANDAAIKRSVDVPKVWNIKGPSLGTVLQVSHYG